jgi:hypothetical protein
VTSCDDAGPGTADCESAAPGLAADARNQFSVCLLLAEPAARRHRRRRACHPGDEYSM